MHTILKQTYIRKRSKSQSKKYDFILKFKITYNLFVSHLSNETEKLKDQRSKIHTIIIDFSSVFYIDSTGVEVLIEVIEELEEFNIKLILCSCSQSVIQMLEKTKYFTRVLTPNICATVHDAVVQNETTFA